MRIVLIDGLGGETADSAPSRSQVYLSKTPIKRQLFIGDY